MEQSAETNSSATGSLEESNPLRVFAFCWQPKTYTCRAVFVPYHLLDSQSQQDIVDMHASGPIFTEHYEKLDDRCWTLDGYFLPDGSLDQSKDLRTFLSKWQRWADRGEMDLMYLEEMVREAENEQADVTKYCPEGWEEGSLFYWMNDNVGSLAPQELYEVLCSMTFFAGQAIQVDYCIVQTELKGTRQNVRSHRFFYECSPEVSLDDLKHTIRSKIAVTAEEADTFKIILSTEEERGYGFVTHLSAEQSNRLSHAVFRWDGNTVAFMYPVYCAPLCRKNCSRRSCLTCCSASVWTG